MRIWISGELLEFKKTLLDLLKQELGVDVLDITLDDISFSSG